MKITGLDVTIYSHLVTCLELIYPAVLTWYAPSPGVGLLIYLYR